MPSVETAPPDPHIDGPSGLLPPVETQSHISTVCLAGAPNAGKTALMNALLRGTSSWTYGIGMFLSNVILGWLALEIARSYSRRERERLEGPNKIAEAHR